MRQRWVSIEGEGNDMLPRSMMPGRGARAVWARGSWEGFFEVALLVSWDRGERRGEYEEKGAEEDNGNHSLCVHGTWRKKTPKAKYQHLQVWCNISQKSSFLPIFFTLISSFKAGQGKDNDRKVLCTGQFFEPLVMHAAGPSQVKLGKKAACTCQTQIYLVSGNTSCAWKRRICGRLQPVGQFQLAFSSSSIFSAPSPLSQRSQEEEDGLRSGSVFQSALAMRPVSITRSHLWNFWNLLLAMSQEHFPYGEAARLATLLWRKVTNQEVKVRALFNGGFCHSCSVDLGPRHPGACQRHGEPGWELGQGVEERVPRHGHGAEGGGVGDVVKGEGGEGGGDERSLGDLCSTKLPGLHSSLPTGKVILGFSWDYHN